MRSVAIALTLSITSIVLLGVLAERPLLYYYSVFVVSFVVFVIGIADATKAKLTKSVFNITAATALMLVLFAGDRVQLRVLAMPFYSKILLLVSDNCRQKPVYLVKTESFRVCKITSSDLHEVVDLYVKFENPDQADVVLLKLKAGVFSDTSEGQLMRHDLTFGSSSFDAYKILPGYFLIEMHVGQEPFDLRLFDGQPRIRIPNTEIPQQ